MTTYNNFQWDKEIRDNGNNVAEFKKINIIYGRNYSGKTTLSRLIRALETNKIPEKYDQPEFEIKFSDGLTVNQKNFSSNKKTIRVFNEDFIKENLKFIFDEQSPINPFAILGENNTVIESKITELTKEIGSEIENSGLYEKLSTIQGKYTASEIQYSRTTESIEEKIRDKANKQGTGIKHNKIYGDANYNSPKLKYDINRTQRERLSILKEEQINEYTSIIKEEPKLEIPPLPQFNQKYQYIAEKSKELIERQIKPSKPIQELLQDEVLAAWVRSGRIIHKNKNETCGFCGSEISRDLWEKLDQHFNNESENLHSDIEALLNEIEIEISNSGNNFIQDSNKFYSKFQDELKIINELNLSNQINYKIFLDSAKNQLIKKKSNIFKILQFNTPELAHATMEDAYKAYEVLRKKSNELTKKLNN